MASSWSQNALAEKLTYLDEKLLQLVFSHAYQAVLRCCCCRPQKWVTQQLLQITTQALQHMHTCSASCTSKMHRGVYSQSLSADTTGTTLTQSCRCKRSSGVFMITSFPMCKPLQDCLAKMYFTAVSLHQPLRCLQKAAQDSQK